MSYDDQYLTAVTMYLKPLYHMIYVYEANFPHTFEICDPICLFNFKIIWLHMISKNRVRW